MIIGVAGKYCAGKNTVAEILESHGFKSIDVDAIGHRALVEEREPLIAAFGNDIVDNKGKIDRKRLGAVVFNDRKALEKLEAVVHPRMVSMIKKQLHREPGARIVINAALLFRMGLDRECNVILWVTAPLIVRIHRARKRDKLSLVRILQRFWSQRKLGPQHSANDVDIYTVQNSGSRKAVETRVREILAKEGA
jgi:dephospho-CoA kinase